MIKDVFNAIVSAARSLFQRWQTLLILLVLYLAMLGSVYLFFSTREATVAQLLLTFVLVIITLVSWLIIQLIAVRYESEGRAAKLLLGALADFWKLAIIVLPLFLVIGLAVYYLGRLESQSVQETVRSVAAPRRTPGPQALAGRSTPWQVVAVSALKYLLLGLVLPLATIHLRIEAGRNGLKNAIKSSGRSIAKAFAPRSVLTYAIGFVVFAIIPYFLVTRRTPITRPWLDVSLFGARLGLAALLSLIGWVVTVGALTRLATSERPTVEQTSQSRTNQGTEHVPAET